ncbi:MAG: 50S ribosomal protein L10 [Candidatus Omnitrophica bacterium CG1_02_40_15]|nr:MAG: 50S ribosomal protein L10 [Candidatus Omnitrophica bacterium CG1_02_40_15]
MAKVALETKKSMVKEITSRLNSAETLIVTRYKGLSVHDINELRKELKRIAGEYLVVKNSMAKIALKDRVNNRIAEFIQGEVGIIVYQKDISVISKALVKFLKDHEPLKICGGFSSGEILSNKDIIAIASLPFREVLLAELANVLNSPIQGLAGSLNGIICKLLYALKGIKDKKGG